MGRNGLDRSQPQRVAALADDDEEEEIDFDRKDPVQDALASVIRLLNKRPGAQRPKPKEDKNVGKGNQSDRGTDS